MGLVTCGRFVEAVIGPYGGTGMMHALAGIRPRRRL
jgi:hypothetical protein